MELDTGRYDGHADLVASSGARVQVWAELQQHFDRQLAPRGEIVDGLPSWDGIGYLGGGDLWGVVIAASVVIEMPDQRTGSVVVTVEPTASGRTVRIQGSGPPPFGPTGTTSPQPE
jgi:hypothetical protein